MTINFTCAGCGSLLKIKDQLAGTDGKCPKCKTEFVVPEAEPDEDSAEILVVPSAAPESAPRRRSTDSSDAISETREPSSKVADSGSKIEKASSVKREPDKAAPVMEKAKPSSKSKKSASDDFDPADFLMGDAPAAVKDKTHRPAPKSDNLSDAEIPTPRRNDVEDRPRKPAGKSSATMNTTGSDTGISASAHAKEMMMKAMEESRLHASDPPPEEKKESFDFAGFFREFGSKVGGAVVACLGAYFLMNYMMSDQLRLPKLGYVTGDVKLDGAPLAGATVYCAPLDAAMAGTKRDRARTSFGITDDKGHYTMMYLQGTPGVAVGKCRVWLDLVGPKGQVIPPDYTEAVMQVREVKPGSQEFPPFDMKSTR